MRTKLIFPPQNQSVELNKIKNHLRILGDDEDELLLDLLEVAISMFEHYTGRVLGKSTFETTFTDSATLPKSPVVAILETTSPARYEWDYEIVTAYGSGEVSVTYEAGYEKLPANIRGWLLNKIATLYEHRENITAERVNELKHIDSVLEAYKVRI